MCILWQWMRDCYLHTLYAFWFCLILLGFVVCVSPPPLPHHPTNCHKSLNFIYTVDLPSLKLHCSRVNCNRKHKSTNQRHYSKAVTVYFGWSATQSDSSFLCLLIRTCRAEQSPKHSLQSGSTGGSLPFARLASLLCEHTQVYFRGRQASFVECFQLDFPW